MKPLFHFSFLTSVLSVFSTLLLYSTISLAQENQIDRLVVFGTSLSDPGNAFVLLSDPLAFDFDEFCSLGTPANVPPYDQLDDFLIPDGSYAIGGHHVTNGASWVEQFARGKGLSGNTRPALRNNGEKASNYAVGGARASYYPCRFNLSDQLAAYQQDALEITDKTLFVIEMGGNDVRDALATGDLSILGDALININAAIQTLYSQGARRFLIVNVPAIGETPAVKALNTVFPGIAEYANLLTLGFNSNLALLQDVLNGALPDVDIRTLDLYTLLNDIIASPENFRISNTGQACITPDIAPFRCKNLDSYLFWDGIHPTKAVHGFMAQRAAEVLM